jgi:thymidylate synthase
MYSIVSHGVESEARGQKTRNVRNMAIVMRADEPPITSFADRKLNIDYCKKEWLWYLGADKFDDSIEEHATMWKKLKQADGSYHSNYGQYIFAQGRNDVGPSQFVYCLKTLRDDPGSRRASMVLLNRDHLYPENTDVVCTYAINFCIEAARLHMTVHMRSNDVIFGFTNDAFCFQQLYSFMYVLLAEKFGDLRHGTYTHIADSMHVYERHFEMIERMTVRGMRSHVPIHVPVVTAFEAAELIRSAGKVKPAGDYSTWLFS